jgi:hypothetical protein
MRTFIPAPYARGKSPPEKNPAPPRNPHRDRPEAPRRHLAAHPRLIQPRQPRSTIPLDNPPVQRHAASVRPHQDQSCRPVRTRKNDQGTRRSGRRPPHGRKRGKFGRVVAGVGDMSYFTPPSWGMVCHCAPWHAQLSATHSKDDHGGGLGAWPGHPGAVRGGLSAARGHVSAGQSHVPGYVTHG